MEAQWAEENTPTQPEPSLLLDGLGRCNIWLGQRKQSGAEDRESGILQGSKGEGDQNLCGEGVEVKGGEAGGGQVRIARQTIHEGV